MFIADFHIHSKYSRATSKECVPETLDLWARRKGLDLIGTGDFTHPAWREELRDKLRWLLPELYYTGTIRTTQAREPKEAASVDAPRAVPITSIQASRYEGTYTNSLYGIVLIRRAGDALTVHMGPDLNFYYRRLTYQGNDRFVDHRGQLVQFLPDGGGRYKIRFNELNSGVDPYFSFVEALCEP